jgi:hypothetical protein
MFFFDPSVSDELTHHCKVWGSQWVPTSSHEAKARVQTGAAVSKPGLTSTHTTTVPRAMHSSEAMPKQCRSNAEASDTYETL